MGQSNNLDEYFLNINLHQGIIIKHNAEVAHLARQHPKMIEVDIGKQTTGKKIWHQVHHYPWVGLAVNLVRTDPAKPLGNFASAVLYLSKTIFSTNGTTLSGRIGIGPGVAGKKFDLYTNRTNNMISTNFNFCLHGRINYAVAMGKVNLNMGLGIVHFSNGSFELPNQGINVPTIFLGVGYQKAKPLLLHSDLPPFKKKWNLNMMLAGGVKEEYPINGPKYLTSSFSIYAKRSVNRKSGLTFGSDVFYDPSIKSYLNDPDLKVPQLVRIGTAAGHELCFGKLSLLAQLGIYLYDTFHLNSLFYQRYGLKWYGTEELFLQLTMKNHYGSIDFVEWGVGCNL